MQKAVKRSGTHGAQALQTQDRNIMPSSGKQKPACITPRRKLGRRTRLPMETNQRKERHNLKERDRR